MRLLALTLLLVACATDPILAPRDCTPGTTSACVCPGAGGVQVCTAEGTVGACVCADAGELPDAPPATDRQELPDAVTARDAGLDAMVLPDLPSATDRLEPDAALPS